MFGKKKQKTVKEEFNPIEFEGERIIVINAGSTGQYKWIDHYTKLGYTLRGFDSGWGRSIMEKPTKVMECD
jgi:hypothetical protein